MVALNIRGITVFIDAMIDEDAHPDRLCRTATHAVRSRMNECFVTKGIVRDTGSCADQGNVKCGGDTSWGAIPR